MSYVAKEMADAPAALRPGPGFRLRPPPRRTARRNDTVFGRKQNDPQVIGIHVGRDTLTIARVAKRGRELELLQLVPATPAAGRSSWSEKSCERSGSEST